MNISELRYAVETASCGSLNGAARKLSVAQPNISRAINNLESEFDIRLFERSSKGVVPTREGQRFLEHAKRIIDEIECLNEKMSERQTESADLRVAIPKEVYASYAFADFVDRVRNKKHMKMHIKECNTLEAIDCILNADYHLAVIRFDKRDEEYCRALLHLKGIVYEEIMEYQLRLLVSEHSPITQAKIRGYDDLCDYIELRQGDAQSLRGQFVDALEDPENRYFRKRIHIYERGSQLVLLRQIDHAYMWETPMPREALELHGLTQIECPWQKKWMKDILIYPSNHVFKKDEQIFLEELKKEAAVSCGAI